ncbi:MAG: NAD(P)H-dependent oxidoreductase [Bacteroidota bacterium]
MKIAILLGSVREGRQTPKITYYLQTQLEVHAGVDADVIDLKAVQLPIFSNRWQKNESPHPNLPRISQLLHDADAIIFASPEYHGSYTGVLKNAVDHYWQEFYRKPIGVVATGAGRYGGINASSEMQQLILSLGAYPIPYKLLVPQIKGAFDDEDQLIDDHVAEAVEKFVSEFLWFSQAITQAKMVKAVP